MEAYYETAIKKLPNMASEFLEEYNENRLSVDAMCDIYKKQQQEWGCHTKREIDLMRDEKTGLYYVNFQSYYKNELLCNHILIEKLYQKKDQVDWRRVTHNYDYVVMDWIMHLLTNPLVWVPTSAVESACIVVGEVAKEEPIPAGGSDRDVYEFYRGLRKEMLLWFADTMPVAEKYCYDRHKNGKLPDDMILWDRLIGGNIFKSYYEELRRILEFIVANRGAAKAVEIIERFRADWKDIKTLHLFGLYSVQEYSIKTMEKALFEEMDRQLNIWKKKAEEERKISIDSKANENNVSNFSNKPGPRKKSLFRNAKGDKDESRSQSEAERLRSYFARHHIKNPQFDASTNSKNNIIVAYFWKIWSEKGLVNNPEFLGEGTAFHRFLTEDCELECPVEEKAFIRVIRTIINSKHIDQEIYSNVASCF